MMKLAQPLVCQKGGDYDGNSRDACVLIQTLRIYYNASHLRTHEPYIPTYQVFTSPSSTTPHKHLQAG